MVCSTRIKEIPWFKIFSAASIGFLKCSHGTTLSAPSAVLEISSLGGQAVSEIIFGDVNPSGKLPLTVARDVGQLRMIYNHKPSAYFHKYAIKKSTPLYPFGYGLSYTNFIYSNW